MRRCCRQRQVPVPEVQAGFGDSSRFHIADASRCGRTSARVARRGHLGKGSGTKPGQYRHRRNACLPLLLLRVRANVTIRAVPRIYLDHNATTPLVPAALERLTAVARETWGNASSVHHFGQQAKAALDEARAAVAALLGAEPPEVVFTAGGTEGDNAAIRGAVEALEAGGPASPGRLRDRARSRAADRQVAGPARVRGEQSAR